MHAYVAILHASWRGRAVLIPCPRTPPHGIPAGRSGKPTVNRGSVSAMARWIGLCGCG